MEGNWHDIWSNKAEIIESPDLRDLMRMDGYDISCSAVDIDELVNFTLGLKNKLNLAVESNVLEIGCGAGAICKILSDNGILVTGVDYTKKLIDVARKVMPLHKFYHADAISYKLEGNNYDLVLCHSVCHYFPDDAYMLQALGKMFECCKKGGVVAITDVHDADLEESHIKRRKETIGEDEYNRLYAHLSHTFFEKKLFYDFSRENNASIEIEGQFLQSESGKFKFNVYLKKK